ncbi:uncharacterized protein LOC114286989 [Camellia sinensis]|uniref:uncharacterized protein LOC114286989 n=1 Tax=Camellia sinensis TaxID=4442 RepID=UPI001036C949|nr:uncharacterized protein LOC114286989 [Camellia sinensis]
MLVYFRVFTLHKVNLDLLLPWVVVIMLRVMVVQSIFLNLNPNLDLNPNLNLLLPWVVVIMLRVMVVQSIFLNPNLDLNPNLNLHLPWVVQVFIMSCILHMM